jgi:cell division septal protein FtsQ
MLDVDRRTKRSKRPKKRTTGSTGQRRSNRRRNSRASFDHTVHTTHLTVYGREGGSLLDRIADLGKGKPRRSQSRLGTRPSWATTVAPRERIRAQPAVHVNGRTLVNVSVIGLLGWLLIWLFASDQFYIREIVVEGNQRVSAEAIQLASGLEGYSIFWVNRRAVAQNIVSALPPIRNVQVQHSLPNAVVLTVEEQGEQVMWVVAGKRYWVDDDGKLHPAQGGNDPKLLVRDIRPGLPSTVDVDAVVAARQIATLLPELTSIEYTPLRGLQFTHPLGWMVYLGVGDDMPEKVYVLHAIEQQLAVEGVRQPDLVDVRYPESPFKRYPSEQ